MRLAAVNAPTVSDILAARSVLNSYLPKTPVIYNSLLSELLGCRLHFKVESFQPTGAFKVRGGVNFMATRDDQDRNKRFITASAGNHGLSLAYAARLFGVEMVVYMPENPNAYKVKAIRHLQAEVRLYGNDAEEAVGRAQDVAQQEGIPYIHHANEPKLIAGVGTMALEIFEDLPNTEVIITPVGAGSCACGNGIVARHVKPAVTVIGVQSQQAPGIWHAWKDRHLRTHALLATEHEGLGTRHPSLLTTPLLWDLLSDFVLVSDDEINQAVLVLGEYAKLIVEGAGAAAMAAVMKIKADLQNKTVVVIVSGGNVPLERLSRVFAHQNRLPSEL